MARKHELQQQGPGGLRRVASAIRKVFTRDRHASSAEPEGTSPKAAQAQSSARVTTNPRRVTRETDIPLDVIDRAYTPPATSSKASFRSDGADHGRDQEYALGVADDRWNDEDRFTNKSGDPRIGTHRRTYEPAEERPESRE